MNDRTIVTEQKVLCFIADSAEPPNDGRWRDDHQSTTAMERNAL